LEEEECKTAELPQPIRRFSKLARGYMVPTTANRIKITEQNVNSYLDDFLKPLVKTIPFGTKDYAPTYTNHHNKPRRRKDSSFSSTTSTTSKIESTSSGFATVASAAVGSTRAYSTMVVRRQRAVVVGLSSKASMSSRFGSVVARVLKLLR
jgi:hypothetical protein